MTFEYFGQEFDEELDEQEEAKQWEAIDPIVDLFRKKLELEAGLPRQVDQDKMKILMSIYSIMTKLTKDFDDARVTYEIDDTFPGSGGVTVTGTHLEFTDAKLLMGAAAMAQNFEVYAKTDGTLVMNFGINGITFPLSE